MNYIRVLILLLIAILPTQGMCKIVRVVEGGAGAKDGTSWANGMQSIQTAIDSCITGDQVWVKAGTYTDHIILKSGVAAYGGFSGTETALSQRRGFPRTFGNPERSMLDGGVWSTTANALVRFAANAGPDTILDGFAVWWGDGQLVNGKKLGGGIYIDGSSPTIRNNYIYSNDADEGGGIYWVNGSPIIEHNWLSCNDATSGAGIKCISSTVKIIGNIVEVSHAGGIYLLSCEATISGNVIDSSSGDGVRVESSVMARPTYITNNTLLSNSVNHIHCINSNCWVYNNIMAWGGCAVCVEGGSVIGGRNNVSVPGTRYYGFTPSPADIYNEPQFFGYMRELGHMAAGAFTIDAGYELPDTICAKDVDGQPRHNGPIDIGADEFYPITYVSTTGTDLNGGTNWADAKRFPDTAHYAASGPVWVARGTYPCNIYSEQAVVMYGGFVGTETSLSQRPAFPRTAPDANETILDGGHITTVIGVNYPKETRIDGFTITNSGPPGDLSSTTGGGLWINAPWTAVITNNRILSNRSHSGAGIYLAYCWDGGEISNNVVSGNEANYGGAIAISHTPSSVRVFGNTISNNTAHYCGGGVYGASDDSTMLNNTLSGNSAPAGGAAYLASCNGIVKSNLVVSNTAAGGTGGGIVCDAGRPVLANNTICRNQSTNGGGIGGIGGSTANITSNIVALNTSGIYSTGSSPALSNNCVNRNTDYNYSGVAQGSGDQTVDPRFRNESTNNFRITLYSPCINSGSNGYVKAGDLDMDGRNRIYPSGATVDCGAYEYADGLVYTPAEARKTVSDGTNIFLTTHGPMICTAQISSNAYYVESADRVSGIQCIGSNPLTLGQTAIIRGVMHTVNGERSLVETTYYGNEIGQADVPKPLEMPNRTIGGGAFGLQDGVYGGFGLSNIGLLIRTTGMVHHAEDDNFYLDDGSGMPGPHVYVAKGVYRPRNDEYVAVTGVSSTEVDGKYLVKVIKTRLAGDVMRL